TGVAVTESVPANASFNAAASTAGWNAAGTSFNVGTVAIGATVTVQYAVTVSATLPAGVTQIANTASVSDDGSHGSDPTPADNTGGDTTPVTALPDLVLTKDDGGITAIPGQVVVYTLTVRNVGNQDATGVTITEAVPANSTFVAASSTAGWNAAGTSFSVGN